MRQFVARIISFLFVCLRTKYLSRAFTTVNAHSHSFRSLLAVNNANENSDSAQPRSRTINPEDVGKAAIEAVTKASVNAEEAARDIAVKLGEAGLEAATGNMGTFQTGPDDEGFSVTTYFFGRDNEFWEDMQRNGVQPRRFFLYSSLAVGIALGGNLFGVTSQVLNIIPEYAKQAHLDLIYPVAGFKRCIDKANGFEFIYPKDWLADQAVALAEQYEKVKPLDPPSVREINNRAAKRIRPLAAFGPPGVSGASSARENVSVVRNTLMPGFTLEGTLGDPVTAAQRLLEEAIAPEGSNRVAQLIEAKKDYRNGAVKEVYQFEYTVQTNQLYLHNVCVIAAKGDELFTLTVVTPVSKWSQKQSQAMQIASSFNIL